MIYPRFSCKYLAFSGSEPYFKPSHQAVDIPRAVTIDGKQNKMANEYLYMAYEGKIVKNKYASDYGWYVEYEVKDGSDIYLFASGHMDSQSSLKIGQTYPMGTVIGKCGRLGSKSTGYHDHFRVTKNGKRVDPLKVCYAYTDWNIQGSKEYAKLNWYTPVKIKTVELDTTKDQVRTLKCLNVRTGAGKTFSSLGTVNSGSIFNVLEVIQASDYTWYKVAENQFIAQDKDKTYLQVLNKIIPEAVISPEEDVIIKLLEKVLELIKSIFKKQ